MWYRQNEEENESPPPPPSKKPNVPMITGVISKEKAKRESLSDTIAGAAVAIVKAVTPRQNVQPSHAPMTSSMSPSKSADLRFNN